MNCPTCKKNDMTYPLARITERVVEWFCHRCRLSWNVVEE